MSDILRGIPFRGLLAALASAAAFGPASRLGAQPFQNPPHVGYAYPAGGRQGTTFEVALGGQNLGGATAAYFSGEGIQAKIMGYERPMTSKQLNELREEAQKLAERRNEALGNASGAAGAAGKTAPEKAAWTQQDQRALAELRRKIFLNNPGRLANPAISETVRLQVTLAPGAMQGRREIRLLCEGGLSNPLVFCVGQLPEYAGDAATVTTPRAAPVAEPGIPPATARAKAPLDIAIPAVVNGQILPGAVDRFRFAAKKGQRLVVAVDARSLMPYLADAVPGWIQATLTLRDAKGRELGHEEGYRFNPDPVISFVVPADGYYSVEIRDAIWRGREDFVYRVSVGELPFIRGIFPLGGRIGRRTSVELEGWNLPRRNLVANGGDDGRGIWLLSVEKDGIASNESLFGLDDLPEETDLGLSHSPETARLEKLPVVVNGRIGRPGEWEVFKFEGKAGEAIVAEVVARRLDSPLDSVLRLTDSKGRQLAYNDDRDDRSDGLHTHHADSYLTATLSSDGTYFIHIGDIQRNGGPGYAYRLRLSEPRPDFELRVTPASANIRGGGAALLTMNVLRKDGFSGPVEFGLVNPPRGVELSGGAVPAGADSVPFTLSAPFPGAEAPAALEIAGRAEIGGRAVTRIAVPAEDMMQAFAYRHLVPARALMVAVAGRVPPRLRMPVIGAMPLRIVLGGAGTLSVGMPPNPPQGRLRLQLKDAPDGISLRTPSPLPGLAAVAIDCDSAKVRPGMSGNLILEAYLVRAAGKGKGAGDGEAVFLDTLPAIPFVIVPR